MSRFISAALGRSGGDSSSQPSNARQTLWKWAAWTSVPLLCAYALAPRSKEAKYAKSRGFDAFLVQQGAVPTGVVSGPSKAGKASSSRAAARTSGGPFECFLKEEEQEDVRNPVDFSSFLRTALAAGHATPALHQAAAVAQAAEQPTADMARVLVLFGTEYGFSKEIAELLEAKLKETKAFWPTVVDMASRPSGMDLSKEQAVLVACSTQGDGVPPTEAREFCDWLFAGKAGPLDHLHFSVCALGDRSYTHYCRCGKSIDEALAKAGAKRFVDRHDVNKEDYKAVNDWIAAVIAGLPSLGLKSIQELGGTCDSAEVAATPGAKPWGKSRPYPAAVVAVEGLCSVSGKDDKNTIRVEFDLGDSGLSYQPGDALGIYATNCQLVVQDLLDAAGLNGATPVPVPSHHYEEPEHTRGSTMPLAAALSKCFDLRSPKPDIFKLLSSLQTTTPATNGTNGVANGTANGHHHAASNGTNGINGKAKVAKAPVLPSLASLQEAGAAQEAYLAVRHVSDVLRDFLPHGVHLSCEQLVRVLRPLQPRLYSISSSPLENSTRVQATIAEVRYETLGRDRTGVCSTFVSQRITPGHTVPVYISKNPDFRLPADGSKPIIMVGPGTGLAPFRAFIKHRLLQGSSASGPMVLYFGCRRSDQDYLYGSLLDEWSSKGQITLFNAFSREQAKKVYVQQRLGESAALVWKLLHEQGGHFYVCGDASSMAGAVEQQLLQIFESNLGQGPEAAAKYLERLSQEHRYERDVWV